MSCWWRKGRRKELSVFLLANTLFLSGREVKRQKYISAHLWQGQGGHSCHFIFFSLVYLLLLSSLPPLFCSFAATAWDRFTKHKGHSFDCTNIHPPHLARRSPFQKYIKNMCLRMYMCVFSLLWHRKKWTHANKSITLNVFFSFVSFFSCKLCCFESKCGRKVLKLMAIVLPNKQTLKSYIGGSGCQNP